ncbi:MAG: orotidine-5'-phosphate decarboxylase, partial [Albimonas sp.]
MSVAPFPARRSATGADPRDRLIVALDVPDGASAMQLAARLGESVTFYKIGLGMLTTG